MCFAEASGLEVSMMFQASEAPLQTKLHGSGPMRIERAEEGRSGYAICPAAQKAGGIHGAGITADNVVSAAARVIRIVEPELSVVEEIEDFRAKLNFAGLRNLKVLQECHVEVQAAWIVQEISTCIAEGQSARRNKLRWVIQQRPNAAEIVVGPW